MSAYVYILLSLKDDKKYIGSTTNLTRRFKQHQNGYVRSTKHRRPLELIGYQQVATIQIAASLEKLYKRSHSSLIRAWNSGKITPVKTGYSLTVE